MVKTKVKKLGRPLKGNSRRTQITIFAEPEIIATVDRYLKGMPTSRSEFYESAVKFYLNHLGVTEA